MGTRSPTPWHWTRRIFSLSLTHSLSPDCTARGCSYLHQSAYTRAVHAHTRARSCSRAWQTLRPHSRTLRSRKNERLSCDVFVRLSFSRARVSICAVPVCDVLLCANSSNSTRQRGAVWWYSEANLRLRNSSFSSGDLSLWGFLWERHRGVVVCRVIVHSTSRHRLYVQAVVAFLRLDKETFIALMQCQKWDNRSLIHSHARDQIVN